MFIRIWTSRELLLRSCRRLINNCSIRRWRRRRLVLGLCPLAACVPGLLPGTSLNNLLFARSTARITCSATDVRGFTVDFNGVEPGQRFGNAGRNILRSDGMQNVDFGIIKNTRLSESIRIQLRADVFNVFNHRNFGIPEARGNAAGFLNQWATDGGNRRIVLGMRLVF